MKKSPHIKRAKDNLLGLDQAITRRDFLNASLLGTGGALLHTAAPGFAKPSSSAYRPSLESDWYGYGGVGDYATSHGNTPEVVATAHRIRDKEFESSFSSLNPEEEYDLVIVGGGMAGLGAAWHFKKHAKPGQKCLMLDNHPIFGGEAKENEFEVDGITMFAPQGANGFFVPPAVDDPEKAKGDPRYYAEFNIPRELPYQQWSDDNKDLAFCRDNYGFLYWMLQEDTSTGHFFSNKEGAGIWAKDVWKRRLENTPLSEQARRSLLAWRDSRTDALQDEAAFRWLDTMSYKDYLEKELKLGPEGSAYADVFLAGAYGLGSDAVSAYSARDLLMPGTLTEEQFANKPPRRNSFPGGNSGFSRYFLKAIIPEAIAGGNIFDDIVTGRINFDNLDKAEQSVRVRLNSTAVSVKHEGGIDNSESVKVVYHKKSQLHAIRAKSVVMASGGWINRHIVKDLPESYKEAYTHFHHVPFLVVNVALTNWRFLYKLGLTACVWDEGFGNSCNIRQPMLVGRHQPPLDPNKPVVLTFYVPFHSPGLPVKTQSLKARTEMLFTSYVDYERKVREQMTRMFSTAGFDPRKDIAGIILNRWGHAFVVPTPGFFFDREDKLAPRNVIRQRYGRIAFGHSELQAFQHWGPAADEGRRATEQILDLI